MKRPGRPSGYLFDFDGTLVDLRTDYGAMRRSIAAVLADFSDGDGAAARVSPADFWTFLETAPDALRSLIFDAARPHERLGLDRGDAIAGARSLLEALAARGIPYAIVTRNLEATVEAAVARFGFPPPAHITSLEHVRHAKPHPEAALLTLGRTGWPPASCIVVGDTHHDMGMASALGLYKVLRWNPLLEPAGIPVPVELADEVITELVELERALA